MGGGVSIWGAACGGAGEGGADLSKPELDIRSGKCCSAVAAGGLLWLTGLLKEAVPSALCGCSEPTVTRVSTGGPLQCVLLCLLNMAERVKLFPQVLQM